MVENCKKCSTRIRFLSGIGWWCPTCKVTKGVHEVVSVPEKPKKRS